MEPVDNFEQFLRDHMVVLNDPILVDSLVELYLRTVEIIQLEASTRGELLTQLQALHLFLVYERPAPIG